MTWYGVNFVLSTGLHSYGFGSGGGLYVLGYMALEVLFIVAVAWKYQASMLARKVIIPLTDEGTGTTSVPSDGSGAPAR